jgi:small-conductance mechanosensitive channel
METFERLRRWASGWPDWLEGSFVNVFLVAVVLAVALGARWLLLFAGRVALRRRKLRELEPVLVSTFSTPVFVLALAVLLAIAGPLFDTPKSLQAGLRHAVSIALVAAATWFGIRAVAFFERVLYHAFDLNREDNYRQRRVLTQIGFVSKMLMVGIFVVGLAGVLFTFREARNLGTSLLASAGVVSVVLGFAAQKSLGNFIAGFQIAFTQPIRLDDVVIVEKEWGRIEEITLTYVVVKLWDLRRLVLPITYFVEKPFENWTRTSAEIVQPVFLYVDFRADVAAVRKAFEQFTSESVRWDRKIVALQLTDCRAEQLELRGIVSARNAGLNFDLRCEVREKMMAWLRQEHPEWLPRRRARVDLSDGGGRAIEIAGENAGDPTGAAPRGS